MGIGTPPEDKPPKSDALVLAVSTTPKFQHVFKRITEESDACGGLRLRKKLRSDY
ncbi:hypothetical protein PQG02_34120 (plasmid) [Nostoc sp. UHCC 0926]|uniref:hypothetical protein n=1 Tax=Nostoc sp. UHCC 0926 TaxID=3025190 RepID=UPI002360160A|nr:hypothetical protein [Nostoc sp. UHCC 0926]WDD36880.1 hypothetical protein PQG02_34120 [Nostoc sp. UHCC 0926]